MDLCACATFYLLKHFSIFPITCFFISWIKKSTVLGCDLNIWSNHAMSLAMIICGEWVLKLAVYDVMNAETQGRVPLYQTHIHTGKFWKWQLCLFAGVNPPNHWFSTREPGPSRGPQDGLKWDKTTIKKAKTIKNQDITYFIDCFSLKNQDSWNKKSRKTWIYEKL